MAAEIRERKSLADEIEHEAPKFFELFDRINDLNEIKVGKWSVRDLMAHVVSWHDECLWALRSTMDGTYERRDYSDFDKVNAELVPRYAGMGAEVLRERMKKSADEIVELIRNIPDDLWNEKPRLSAWATMVTLTHYEEHKEDLT